MAPPNLPILEVAGPILYDFREDRPQTEFEGLSRRSRSDPGARWELPGPVSASGCCPPTVAAIQGRRGKAYKSQFSSQAGGPVIPGVPYLVGEHGPEPVVLRPARDNVPEQCEGRTVVNKINVINQSSQKVNAYASKPHLMAKHGLRSF
jgi:hypothetical protein